MGVSAPEPPGDRGGVRIAWLSLDEADNDPARFLAYLVAALGQILGGVPEGTRAALQSPQPLPPEAALTDALNAIAAHPAPLILALDDYHVIHTPVIHPYIAFLLERLPPQAHLVLMTREDPLLSVARLRARGQVVEIRQDDLRFTLEECRDFLHSVLGIRLAGEDVAALERRTEGWIAGLQLAALSMRGRDDLSGFIRSFTGSSRFILDYLVEEVFAQQPTEVQDFLLKTSILERLSGPLCDVVVEMSGSQVLLEHLEQANLFIVALDSTRSWYRYHHLFAELLRHRLRLLGQPLESALHRRASQWHQAEGFTAEAIQHALAAQDWERSAGLIEQAGSDLLKCGELITLIGWCEKLPETIIDSRPALGLSYAWALAMLGQFDPAEGWLAKIEAIASAIPPLLGQVASAQAFVARGKGDNPRAIEKSHQALALLPASDAQGRGLLAMNLGLVYWHAGQLAEAAQVLSRVEAAARQTGNVYALVTAQIFLARTLASQGALRRAAGMYREIIEMSGQAPILALAHYDLCGLYYEWNELEKAGEHLEHGLALCTRSGNLEFQNSGHLLKAFLLLACGDPGGALAEAEISQRLAQGFNLVTQARSTAANAQVALVMGDIDTAARWVDQMAVDVDPHPFYRFVGLIRPRLLIAQGQKRAAAELLKGCYESAVQAGWGYARVAIRILQALTTEERREARSFLAEALRASQAEGYLRAYVDAGSVLVPLLQESARGGAAPEYIGQILSALGEGRRQTAAQPLVEALSERELEVLRLVAAGLSNREIARQLVISPGTAKTHIHNICGKLEARNRTEAALRAKELKLV